MMTSFHKQTYQTHTKRACAVHVLFVWQYSWDGDVRLYKTVQNMANRRSENYRHTTKRMVNYHYVL